MQLTNNIGIWVLLLVSLVASAVCTIMIKNLLKAAISLAVASAILTVIMYLMGATLAAVLELSVCAGLITAVFVSTISMTKPTTDQEQAEANKAWLKRVVYLPIILVAAAACTWMLWPNLSLTFSGATSFQDITSKLWNESTLAVLGQILVVLAGVFGVIVLFRGKAVKK